MQEKMYDNEFVMSKENMAKNEETLSSEELVLTKEPEQNESYKRVDVDGGVLNNDSDIEYFKAIQYNDIIDNCLLGDFDSKGNYVVNPVIVEQLLKIKKIFVSAFEKSVFVESIREFDGYGKINFRLKWTNNNQGQKVVVLELLENVTRVNGYFENTNHVALLGVAINDDTSTEAVYKYFNVVKKSPDDNDDGAEKEDNRDIIDIINRIAYFQIAKVGQRKFMAKYYKDAYEKKIALLSKNKRGAYLLEDFNKEYLYCNNRFFKEGDVEYYKYLNQLIDAIIERNIDFIKDDKELVQALRDLNKQSANVFRTTNDMVLNATNQKTNEIKHKATELNKNVTEEQVENKPQPKVQDTQKVESVQTSTGGSKFSKNKEKNDYILAGAGNQKRHHMDKVKHMDQPTEKPEEGKDKNLIEKLVKTQENLDVDNNLLGKLGDFNKKLDNSLDNINEEYEKNSMADQKGKELEGVLEDLDSSVNQDGEQKQTAETTNEINETENNVNQVEEYVEDINENVL